MASAFIDSFHISWREILDIAIVTYVFYRGLLLIHGTRAVSVLHGFLLILILYYLSGEFGLNTLHWLLTNFLSSIFLVIIICFRPTSARPCPRWGRPVSFAASPGRPCPNSSSTNASWP